MQRAKRSFASLASAQTPSTVSQPIAALVSRLSLDQFKAHIKGLAQFGDRLQGSDGNRKAIDWLEQKLKAFGYTNVERLRYMSAGGPLEDVYATKCRQCGRDLGSWPTPVCEACSKANVEQKGKHVSKSS